MVDVSGLYPSFHKDTFARDNLPPPDQWPVLTFDRPELQFPPVLNCIERLLDHAVFEGASRPAVFWQGSVWSYADLAGKVNRIAHVLVEDAGIISGNRVLLHGPNTPEMLACWLAIVKTGGIAVTTMAMLRTHELKQVIEKAQVSIALCDESLVGELESLLGFSTLEQIITFNGSSNMLGGLMAGKPSHFPTVPTSQDDVCLIAFTSGTTGVPKAALHFHRDVMAMCETFARHALCAGPGDVFSGTPPIGFTFGLGGQLVFPLYFRAAIALAEDNAPDCLARTIERCRVTHFFGAPRIYRKLADICAGNELASLRQCVSAGEALSKTVSDIWYDRTGIRIIDGIGSTEMIHIFIAAGDGEARPGATGKPVPGYIACLFDEDGTPLEGPATGRLGVRGPTGCRYLSDTRQLDYVVGGWNITGDIYRRDEDGYFWWVSRVDDMILSSGYNIAGPEVENAILLHPDVEECAVVGEPDADRGQIVKAVVVARQGARPGPQLARALQEHVKRTIAPYKYPRSIEFRLSLPKTSTGKLQRFSLRRIAPPRAPFDRSLRGNGIEKV